MKHQVNFADCYVLSPQRNTKFIHAFLHRFLPHRQEYAGAFEINQEPHVQTITFTSLHSLLYYLEQNKQQQHAIYWYNKEETNLKGALCIFTSDGQVIYGLFCESHFPDTSTEDHYLNALMEFCNSTKGLIEYSTPAAKDTDEFITRWEEQARNKQN